MYNPTACEVLLYVTPMHGKLLFRVQGSRLGNHPPCGCTGSSGYSTHLAKTFLSGGAFWPLMNVVVVIAGCIISLRLCLGEEYLTGRGWFLHGRVSVERGLPCSCAFNSYRGTPAAVRSHSISNQSLVKQGDGFNYLRS